MSVLRSISSMTRGSAGTPRQWWPSQRGVAWLACSLAMLAASLAAAGIGSPRVLWGLWWAMVPALAALGVGLWAGSPPRMTGWNLAVAGLIGGAVTGRATLTMAGPLPAEGLREAYQWGVILLVSGALWSVGRRWPVGTIGLWTLAMAIGWVMETVALERVNLVHPAQFFPALSGLLGCIGLVWLAWPTRSGRSCPPERGAWFLKAVGLIGGLALGGWLAAGGGAEGADLASLLQVRAGRWAQEHLWLQSLLVGWGWQPLDRLVEVAAEPAGARLPGWGGPVAVLAWSGVTGMAALAMLALALLGRTGGRAARHGTGAAAFSGVAALVLLGVLAAGGQAGPLAMLAVGGWSALALTDQRTIRSRPASLRSGEGQSGKPWRELLWVAGATLVVIVAFVPMYGTTLHHRATRRPAPSDRARAMLARAARYNPLDPAIETAIATQWRKELSRTPGWSQTFFNHACQAYRRARRLDPFATLIVLEQARFLLLCERPEEAFRVVRSARHVRPSNQALLDWMYMFGMGRERPDVAREAIGLGLATAPHRASWWRRAAQTELVLDQPSGSPWRPLSVLLTARPDDPQWVAWWWHHQPGRSAAHGPPPEPRATEGNP